MSVLILVAANARKTRTQAFSKADVLALGRKRQETVRLFDDEAQLVGSPLEQSSCPLVWVASFRSLCEKCHQSGGQ